jgi:D-alanyl-D-alanine carboxypeptidase
MGVDGVGSFGTSGEQEPVPIASLAKVMTAYVILRDHPLETGAKGPDIPIDQQAEDDAGLSDDGESTVDVQEGDTMSEFEALQAIMIASANNVARLLARWDAGSEEAFVGKMNDAAAELGMENTTYTDPSGLDPHTVSTAADQLRVLQAAMRFPAFRQIVSMASVTLPVAGTLTNYNPLITAGYAGKTGSDTAAGGCLAFFTQLTVHGRPETAVGVILGQGQGSNTSALLAAAGEAATQLVQSAAPAVRVRTIGPSGTTGGPGGDAGSRGYPLLVAPSRTPTQP